MFFPQKPSLGWHVFPVNKQNPEPRPLERAGLSAAEEVPLQSRAASESRRRAGRRATGTPSTSRATGLGPSSGTTPGRCFSPGSASFPRSGRTTRLTHSRRRPGRPPNRVKGSRRTSVPGRKQPQEPRPQGRRPCPPGPPAPARASGRGVPIWGLPPRVAAEPNPSSHPQAGVLPRTGPSPIDVPVTRFGGTGGAWAALREAATLGPKEAAALFTLSTF